jgi:hypothetical protein
MPELVVYPAGFKSDLERLFAVYSISEQALQEYNKQGAKAETDWEKYQGKWQEYRRRFYALHLPILEEQNRLKKAIQKANYADSQWASLSLEQKDLVCRALFGDKQAEKVKPTEATCQLLEEIEALDLEKLEGNFVDPPEDLTSAGWTESDPGGTQTITASKVQATNTQSRSTDTYLYKDYTANHFDALNIEFEICYSSGSGNYEIWGGPGLTVSAINDLSGFGTTDLLVAWRYGAGGLTLYLYRGPGTASDYTSLVVGTLYYCTLSRAAGNNTAVCYIYSNSSRTTLVDSNSVAGYSTTKWRYLFASNDYNDGTSNRLITAYVQNIDLQEEPSITEKSASDTGAGADAGADYPAAVLAQTEAGAGAESLLSKLLAASETGNGVDAGAGYPAAASVRDEGGSGVESMLARILAASEAGCAVDAGVGYPAAVLARAEAAAGVEMLLTRLLAVAESGAGLEAVADGNPLAGLLASDDGIGLEALVALVQSFAVMSGDAGLGSDALMALLGQLTVSDIGLGNEGIISRLFSRGESGSGGEFASLLASVIATGEAGSATEASLSLPAIVSGDAGLGSELVFLLKAIVGGDGGKAVEMLKYLIETSGQGADMRLHLRSGQAGRAGEDRQAYRRHGQIRMPSKEVGL